MTEYSNLKTQEYEVNTEEAEPGEAELSQVDNEVEDIIPDKEALGGSDLFRIYSRGVGKIALLNAAEEVELAKRIEAGLYAVHRLDEQDQAVSPQLRRDLRWVAQDGERAKDHLIEANLRLVISEAKRRRGQGLDFLDLIQEGNLGLMRAVERFDYTKGFKFSTYATWWIRQAIGRALADQGRTIRIPVHMVEAINKIARVERELLQDLGREPTPEELAKETNLSVEKVVEAQKLGRHPLSLEQPVGEEGSAELGDFIQDDDTTGQAEGAAAFVLLQEALQHVLATLSEREAGVIRLRYGFDGGKPRTLEAIGDVYHVSRERIRQIEKEVMSKLRDPSRAQFLEGYLD